MNKKYLIPAYIRRNVVLNLQIQNKPKTWKNSYWLCALIILLLGAVFYALGLLLKKDLPADIAAYTTMCLFGITSMFIIFEVFDLQTED